MRVLSTLSALRNAACCTFDMHEARHDSIEKRRRRRAGRLHTIYINFLGASTGNVMAHQLEALLPVVADSLLGACTVVKYMHEIKPAQSKSAPA